MLCCVGIYNNHSTLQNAFHMMSDDTSLPEPSLKFLREDSDQNGRLLFSGLKIILILLTYQGTMMSRGVQVLDKFSTEIRDSKMGP